MNFAGDGPDAGPEIVKTGVLDPQPIRQVPRVGERRAQPHEAHLLSRQKRAYDAGVGAGDEQGWTDGWVG